MYTSVLAETIMCFSTSPIWSAACHVHNSSRLWVYKAEPAWHELTADLVHRIKDYGGGKSASPTVGMRLHDLGSAKAIQHHTVSAWQGKRYQCRKSQVTQRSCLRMQQSGFLFSSSCTCSFAIRRLDPHGDIHECTCCAIAGSWDHQASISADLAKAASTKNASARLS